MSCSESEAFGQVASVVDVGSNTVKLLVASLNSIGGIQVLHENTVPTRIGTGIGSKFPVLSEHAMLAAEEAVVDLLHEASRFAPHLISLVATGAVRAASNGQKFADRIKNTTEHDLLVLSGDDEAEGIAAGLATDPGIAVQPDFLACDLGGGSLELIAVEDRKVSAKTSLPLGAIRLTESYINNSGECVSANEIEAIDHYVQDTLFASEFPFPSEVDTLVATGGAFVAIRSILADRENASFEKRSLLFHEEIKSLLYEIAELTLRERIERLHRLSPNRADVMPAALACIVSLLSHVGARTVRNSLHNLRYGEAARMLGIVG